MEQDGLHARLPEPERLYADAAATLAVCGCEACLAKRGLKLDLTYWDKVWLAAMRIAQPE